MGAKKVLALLLILLLSSSVMQYSPQACPLLNYPLPLVPQGLRLQPRIPEGALSALRHIAWMCKGVGQPLAPEGGTWWAFHLWEHNSVAHAVGLPGCPVGSSPRWPLQWPV